MFLFGYFPPFPSSFFCSLKRYFPYLNISLPFLFYSSSLPQRNSFLLNIFRSFSISCAKRYFPLQIFPSFPFPCLFSTRKKIFSFFEYFPSQTGIQLPFYLIYLILPLKVNFLLFHFHFFIPANPTLFALLTLPLEVIVGEVSFISPTLQSHSSELNMWWERMVDKLAS